jgi:hypothetical protein
MCNQVGSSNSTNNSFCTGENYLWNSKICFVAGLALSLVGVIFAGNMIACNPSFVSLSQWSTGQIIFFSSAIGGGILFCVTASILNSLALRKLNNSSTINERVL